MALVQWARGGRARQVWIHYCGIGANQAAVLGGEAAADESGVAMVPIDVAERGGITLEEVGGLMNLTRERVRQLEAEALTELQTIVDFTEEDMTELGARIE